MFYLSEGLYVMDKSEMSQCMVSTAIESSFQDIQKQGATGEYIISENIDENEPNFENQQDGIKISAFKLNDAKTNNGDVEYNSFDFLTMDSNENEGSSSTSRDEKSSSMAKSESKSKNKQNAQEISEEEKKKEDEQQNEQNENVDESDMKILSQIN